MGLAYACHLDVYLRTIVYGLHLYVAHDEEVSPAILSDSSDFRAAIVTDPLRYLSESDFSAQFRSDKNSADLANDRLDKFADEADRRVFIVVQIRQELDSFSADDGQCRQIGEELALVNCGEPSVPAICDSTDSINAVLTAVKMKLDITDGLDKHLVSCLGNSLEI